jgi:hypothetical protein
VLLHVVLGPLYIVIFGALGLYFAACFLALTIGGAITGLLVYTRRGKAHLGGTIVSTGFFCTITVALVARGGMTSNSAAWLLLAPVLAFMMVGPRHGIQIAVATAAVFTGLWGVEQMGFLLPAGLPPELANFSQR